MDANSIIEIASVTKLVVTSLLIYIAVSKGMMSFDDLVSKYFPVPLDKQDLKIKHLMYHSIGFNGRSLCLNSMFYDNCAEQILNIPSQWKPGSKFSYCCASYILLGKIIEKVFCERLDIVWKKEVAEMLNLDSSNFLPKPDPNKHYINVNLSDKYAYIANDYNCRYLGNITGNAGLFSSMNDLQKIMNVFLNNGYPLVKKEVLDEAMKNYTPDSIQSRFLGGVYIDNKYNQTGTLFPDGSFGHGGHTGQHFTFNRESKLYVIFLSDLTKNIEILNGYDKYDDVILYRSKIHSLLKEDLHL